MNGCMRSAANGRRDEILRRGKKVQAQTIKDHRILKPVPQGQTSPALY